MALFVSAQGNLGRLLCFLSQHACGFVTPSTAAQTHSLHPIFLPTHTYTAAAARTAAIAISTPRIQRSKLFADVAGTFGEGKRGEEELKEM